MFNEVESLPELQKQIHTAMGGYPTSWEIIYVDDGSRDGSLQALEVLAARDLKHTRVVALRPQLRARQPLFRLALTTAAGNIIVLMDADLQNDPADIPLLLDKIDEGYDLVSGWRKSRQDTYLTRTLPSNIANRLISRVTGVHLHDYGCTLKAYRREVLTGFRLYGEMHRFIPAYAGYVGANVTEVVVTHRPRKYGSTNYGLERTIKVILDLFTVKFLLGYVNKPIYLFGGFGMGLIGLGIASLAYLVIRKYFFFGSIADSPIFFLSIVSLILGVQSIFSGLIAEMSVRTYHRVAV